MRNWSGRSNCQIDFRANSAIAPGGNDRMKQVRGYFLSPFPAAILGGLVSWASGAHPRPVSIAILYLLLLYGAQLLFGILIRTQLIRHRRTSAFNFVSGGLAMTAIPTAPYIAWAATVQPYYPSYALAVFGLMLA